ncbi:MAG: SCP2 sterol-binding domain-containing protein [Gammaproteobacteria bacterium]
MQSVTEKVESFLNRIISDSGAVAHARALEGRVISVWIKGVEIGRMATFHDGELRVLPEHDQDPDVSICGTPIGLIRLLRAGAEPAALRDSSVRIEGDGSAMLDLKALLAALDVDAEEELAQWVGDTLARKLAIGARGFSAWASDVADSSLMGVAETLVEESRLLPSQLQAERLVDGVERLRDDVARLAQRVDRLELSKPGNKRD